MYASKAPSNLTPVAASAAQIVRRMNAMKALRLPHEYVWRDCFDHSFILRGSGLQQDQLSAQNAIDRRARLVDSTATDAGRILAASMQGGLTPANARWFALDVQTADDAGKAWLDSVADQLHVEIHNANFDSESLDCMLDMVAAGWFVMFIDDAKDENGRSVGLSFESWPLAECYFSSSRSDGTVDTVYHVYQRTAEQCVAEFGDAVSAMVKKKAVDTPDEMIDLVHAIYPRVGSNGKLAKSMAFASCKAEIANQHLLVEGGFHEFPCAIPRMNRIPGSPYAVGPMFDALPDARMLNQLKRMDLANADLAIAGMWIAKDDGVLNPRTVKVGARKIIVANDTESMKPLVSGGNWQLADERIAQLQAAIRKLLMADQLQPQDGPAMTATEIHARIALIRQQLGPTFGRMQSEYLRMLVERCFWLGYRAGAFPPPPQSIAGANFTVRYTNPLARAQNLEDVTAIQNALAFILQVQPFQPEVLDNYDLDEMSRTLSEAQGVPQKCMRDMQAVMALRKARAQQQAAQQQQAQAQQLQGMAADAAFKGAQQRAANAA